MTHTGLGITFVRVARLSPQNRKLNSDQLGKKGEDRFSELCSDAGLVCNKSTYDRTGWDFIVEFLFDSDPKVTLDKRQAPLSCHVQVKTMWEENNAFTVPLSSAERLAKEPKPAFFFIFKVNDNLEFVEAHLLPVLDETLERILKRLREEHAKSGSVKVKLNSSLIKFSLDRSMVLPAVTGQALRDQIISCCGSDSEVCMRTKSNQLKRLGYEASAYQTETTFVLQENDEIVEVLLGLKPAQLTRFKVFETRFGVQLPLDESNQGLMHIQPEPADRCTILVKSRNISTPATFSAEILAPPISLPKSEMMLLVRASLFEIRLRHDRFSFSTKPEATTTLRLPLQEWINYFRMLVIFSRGESTITMIPERLTRVSTPITVDDVPDAIEHANSLKAFESAEALFRLSGAHAPNLLQKDVLSVGQRIVAIAGLFADPSTAHSLNFRASWRKDVTIPETIRVLYIDAIEIAGNKLAFSAIAEMTHHFDGSELHWRSRSLEPREISPVRDLTDDYDAFANRSKAETGISTVMLATYKESEIG